MFREISKAMATHGCNYTPIQVEIKWRSLEKKYKKSLQHNNKTGRNRQKIEFESELGEILNQRAGVIPEYVLSSTGDGKSRSNIIKEHNIEAPETETNGVDTSPDDVSTPKSSGDSKNSTQKTTRKRKVTTVRDVMESYQENRKTADEEKAMFRGKFLDAYNRQTEAIEKRNTLLESLIGSSNPDRLAEVADAF